MRRLVIRFKDGSTTSLDLVPGREREDLLRHLRHFPGKEVASVEEQVYDPEHPRRFRYVRREDLLRHLRHFPGKEVASVEEQVYDPEHPRRFRYVRREDLEGLLLSYKGEALGEGV